jgi:hypothetical protein
MKQDAVNGRRDAPGAEEPLPDEPGIARSGLAEPQAQQELDLWPAEWAWEEDNHADGVGVGPFPGRKPPKRADRRPPGVIEDPTGEE